MNPRSLILGALFLAVPTALAETPEEAPPEAEQVEPEEQGEQVV